MKGEFAKISDGYFGRVVRVKRQTDPTNPSKMPEHQILKRAGARHKELEEKETAKLLAEKFIAPGHTKWRGPLCLRQRRTGRFASVSIPGSLSSLLSVIVILRRECNTE